MDFRKKIKQIYAKFSNGFLKFFSKWIFNTFSSAQRAPPLQRKVIKGYFMLVQVTMLSMLPNVHISPILYLHSDYAYMYNYKYIYSTPLTIPMLIPTGYFNTGYYG